MRVSVLLNCAAGSVDAAASEEQAQAVEEAFDNAGVSATVALVAPDDVRDAVTAAARDGGDAVVVGGGDGTLNGAAAVLAGGEVPLGILPLGTFNHFAKSLGLPLDLPAAARVVAAGVVRRVDLAEVNGHVFLNNSSVGVYPRLVLARDRQERRFGHGRRRAMARAALGTLRRLPLMDVTVTTTAGEERLRTPFVFVGNNRYELSVFGGQRDSLRGGELCLYAAHATSLPHLLLSTVHVLLRGCESAGDWETRCVPALELGTTAQEVRVALDGEVRRLEDPLRYRSRPGALAVLAPPPEQ